jgi:hypothetical protein
VTTELIRLWTMEGAARDSEGRFRSADDLRAALAPRWTEEADEVLKMRGADEEDWRPFLLGIEGDGARG